MKQFQKHFLLLTALLVAAACAGRGRATNTSNNAVYKHLADKLSEGHNKLGIQKIAILPFSHIDRRQSSDGVVISEKLITSIANEGKLEIVERSLLAKVLEELELQHSGVVDEKSIKGMGKILGVDAVVAGTLMKQKNGSLEINARLIKTETASILTVATGNVYPDWDSTEDATKNIAVFLPSPDFPMSESRYQPSVPGPVDNSPVTVTNGAARWWPADGTAVEKLTGAQGVLANGADFGPGVIREAFVLDGTDDYIAVGRGAYYDALFDGQHPFSISFFLHRVAASHHQGILSKGKDPFMLSLALNRQGSGYQVSLNIKRAHNSKIDVSTVVLDHPSGQWEHWAVTYGGNGAAAVKIYRNGMPQPLLVHGDTLGSHRMINNDSLEFGRIGEPLNWQLESSLDDVKLFTKALSEKEVAMLSAKLQASAAPIK